MRVVHLTHDYPFPAQAVWDVAIDYDCLAEIVAGLITFDGLPSGQVRSGQKASVMVSLFGRLPPQPYHMEVTDFDGAGMSLTSLEQGAGVKSWRHTLQVSPTQTGCTLSDRIEIDAGLLTLPFAWWAQFLYAKRHKPRLRVLQRRHNKDQKAQI